MLKVCKAVGPDWRGMGPADPETGQRVSSGCRADDEYGVSFGGCLAGNSSEPMAQAYPNVPAEEDQEPKKAPNKANLESTQTSLSQKVESGLTGPAGENKVIHERGVVERRWGPTAFLWCQKVGGPFRSPESGWSLPLARPLP